MSKIVFFSGVSSKSNVHNMKLPENILKCHLVHYSMLPAFVVDSRKARLLIQIIWNNMRRCHEPFYVEEGNKCTASLGLI